MQFNNNIKRITAVCLSLTMVVTMLPAGGMKAKTGSKDIRLWKKKVNVQEGKSCKVKYKASKKIKVKSKSRKIARASVKKQNIIIKGIKKGTTKITVSCGKTKAYIKVAVKKAISVPGSDELAAEVTAKPIVDSQVALNLDKCVTSINSFSNDMFSVQSNSDMSGGNNTFVSPLSMYTALMILANGARGNTKTQMCQALGIDNFDEYNQKIGAYMKGTLDPYVEFNVANSVWLNKNFGLFNTNINKEFIKPVTDIWNSEIKKVDSFNKTIVDDINNWCDKKTNGMIPEIIKYRPAYNKMAMMIINALYFNGRWYEQFSKWATVPETFKGKNRQSTVDMMTDGNAYYGYFKNDKIEAVELKYGNKSDYKNSCNYAMDIIIPADKNQYIGDIWNSMTADEKLHIIDNFGLKNGTGSGAKLRTLKIPKFKVEGNLDNPIEFLKSKGMTDVFSEAADLSAIGKKLFVEEIIHKAVIEVDEEGSKAAAVTVIAMPATSAYVKEQPPEIDFIADVPFMFIIRDRVSGTIIFMGQVNDL